MLSSLTAGAGLAVSACTGSESPPPKNLKHLTGEEYSLFEKAVEVLLPTEKLKLTPVDKVPLFENIDRMMGDFHPAVRKDLGIGLKLFTYGSIFIGLHFSRFVNLSTANAAEYCRAWQSGNAIQRGVFSALRQIVYLSYWSEPETWGPIGYDGPVTERFGIPRLGNAPMPDEAEAEKP